MMEMSHNHMLIVASLVVAMMAGFTGLSLMQGASMLSVGRRKIALTMASVAMGSGIWSMHFVAMLGMKLPIPFYYDAPITLISALIAILVVGLSLIILHFLERNIFTLVSSGVIVGAGILAMHYVGMSGIRLVRPEYSVGGLVTATLTSVTLGVGTVLIAYQSRNRRNIMLGTVGFGLAVFCVHFVAMMGTAFFPIENASPPKIWLSNEVMAIGVAIASFAISGAFLLTGISFLPGAEKEPNVGDAQLAEAANAVPTQMVEHEKLSKSQQSELKDLRIPYEKDGRTHFLQSSQMVAARAEGHYTILYSKDNKHFCPWSISEIGKRLAGAGFVQTHRSYLVNPKFISGFERTKDTGVCFFESAASLEKIPVSRSKLALVRQELGLV